MFILANNKNFNIMKKLLLLLALPMIGFGQNVNIPDPDFKQYLVGNAAINTNGDAHIQVSEASAFNGSIICMQCGWSDLTGIQAFTALTVLKCNDNDLATLDVSQNIALTILECDRNNLTTLDVSQNTALTKLSVWENNLTSLNVNSNIALMNLICKNNEITTLDLSQNTALTSLNCEYNQISSLDVSQNTALISLGCSYNLLTSMIVDNNAVLEKLTFANNQITSLNVTNNTELTQLNADNNLLTSLDVRNGNNSNMTISGYSFRAVNNPNLTCVSVDDPAWSTIHWYNTDPWMTFSSDCSGTTSIQQLITITNKKLLKVTDLLGRETQPTNNEVLIYMYDDGTTEKKFSAN